MKKQKNKIIKMSLYLPESYIMALDLVKNTERLNKSQQIRFGLDRYFGERYKKLLLDNGVDIWKK